MSYHIDPNNLQIPSFGDPHLSAAGDQHHFISDHLNSHPSTSARAATRPNPTWPQQRILPAAGRAPPPPQLPPPADKPRDEVNVSARVHDGSPPPPPPPQRRRGEVTWQSERQKAEILAHPLYEQLLSAHVRVAEDRHAVDQLAEDRRPAGAESARGGQVLGARESSPDQRWR
ncbi:uncharacterized protein A4U43_C05F33170 [Asparagus officinalis]|uniref:KNOX1 domain-containing protein n=1 Tax=Asparagus officinalis TaxID=4686 RepID=A0A5P1EWC2_ASPOF|nr:uncharacterized protein A4U43_C05F33170 [Asparagus officinalis]